MATARYGRRHQWAAASDPAYLSVWIQATAVFSGVDYLHMANALSPVHTRSPDVTINATRSAGGGSEYGIAPLVTDL